MSIEQLMEAIRTAHGHIDMAALEISHCKDAELIRAALSQQPAVQTERDADGLPLIVAGAIFDFAGFMTTRAKVIEVGSTANAGPVADLVKEWAELRGLSLADAAVLSWQLHMTSASMPAPQQPDNQACKSVQKRLEAQQPATPEPVGFTYQAEIEYANSTGGNGSFWRAPPDLDDEAVPLYTHPAPPVPGDVVRVPLQVLKDASEAIGNFVSDLGWGDDDMQAMDNLDAYIAQHEARAAMLADKDASA